jgi:hypothetical protein
MNVSLKGPEGSVLERDDDRAMMYARAAAC